MGRNIDESYSQGKFFDHRVDSPDGDVFGFSWVVQIEKCGLIVT